MAKYIISGGKKLTGEVYIPGAKNAAIKMIAAAILTKKDVILHNVPDIVDVQSMLQIFSDLGGTAVRQKNTLILNAGNVRSTNPKQEITKKLRASVVYAGPLLARFGHVKMFHPGGCVIGARPIDFHVKGFVQLGAKAYINNRYYEITADNLTGSKICFDDFSVTATENILLAAVLAKGHTSIRLAAFEPEVVDLIVLLKKMGAKIKVSSYGQIEVDGIKKLNGAEHTILPDRIEAGTFIVIAAATRGHFKIHNFIEDHNDLILYKLAEIGVKFKLHKNMIEILHPENSYHAVTKIITRNYPGFPTDLQAPMSVLLSQAKGKSKIVETIFENRLQYLHELNKMGAKAKILDSHTAYIEGPTKLHGTKIETLDLRAGATLVAAALTAHGESIINNVEIIDRGYADFDTRLRALGADIQRLSS